jgi:hypothetical protein
MSGDSAIKLDQPWPADSKGMGGLACPKCGQVFILVHPLASSDSSRAEQQVKCVQSILAEEHSTVHFSAHNDSYDLASIPN